MSSDSEYQRLEQRSSGFIDFFSQRNLDNQLLDEGLRSASVEEQVELSYSRGYSAGLQQGRDEQHQLNQRQLEEMLENELLILHAAQAKLIECQNWFFESTPAELVRLALEIAKRMTRTHLSTEAASVLPIVEQAIRMFPAFIQSLQIRLHPFDLLRIQNRFKQEIEGRRVTLHADDTIEPGGCILSTDINDMDVTNQQRWAKICEILDQECPWILSER